MPPQESNPLLRPLSILLAGVSLAIGWGIRGNYGHETGAMFPGALTAIAVCLLSGREDWRQRVGQFALFGMLGWGFGGSMSYMQVIGFSQSGHAPTQLFGFAGLFFIGFLWAALGGMGTALPAVMDKQRLNNIFKPLVCLLAIWVVLYVALFPIMRFVQAYLELDGFPAPMQRQESGLYWFDSDWFTVLFVLSGVLLFDFFNRRCGHWLQLLLFSAIGAAVGLGVMFGLTQLGWTESIYNTLVQHQGVYGDRFTADQLAVTNWPPIILHFATHEKFLCTGDLLGILLGLMVGITVYFALYGQFRDDSGLFLWMACGWFVGFLALPVLGSLLHITIDGVRYAFADIGGLRMTPPRGDNWAGVLGTFLGASIYLLRHRLKAVVLAGVVCGIIGGLGFSGISLLQGLLLSVGNERVSDDPAIQQKWTEWQQTEWEPTDWMDKTQKMPTPAFVNELRESRKEELAPWQHFHRQNWHSFLEQTYGFVNGLAVIFAMAIVLPRVPKLDDDVVPRQRWTEIVSITFALPALVFVNMFKNIKDWSPLEGAKKLLPNVMKAPWIDFEMSAGGWFNFFFALATVAFVGLMIAHTRRRLAIVPASWIGRGQLLYFLLLWAFVLGNFAKALAYFGEGRLLTEGIIIVNAVIATVLVLLLPREGEQVRQYGEVKFNRWLLGSAVLGLILLATVPFIERKALRSVYGDARVGHGGINRRFDPNANWNRIPLLKGQQHR
ncbi:hypothetical protein Pan258_23330 [Symmachiella dynata]|uniref:hypothetical protein n=1 Tax=Symmachiella dynata TaxID=2527995 RepID=UPI00118A58C7|nr:hypothetical protein [Symmachiella dynata]QDT48292.1 hypothetical protein Pan258_23330 [Symmachiella dynata]